MVAFRFPIVSFTNQAVKNWITFCVLFFLSLVAQLVKNLPAMQETPLYFWVRKIPWRRDRLPTPVLLGFPGGSDDKESACNMGDLGSVPGLGRSPGGGHGNPIQYSCLENPKDRRAWPAIVHGVTESQTRLKRLSSSSWVTCLPWTPPLHTHCGVRFPYWEGRAPH